MTKRMLIDAVHPEETRVAIADDRQIFDFDFVSTSKKQLKGNIYLAKITRVEPSLQAAFVEYGGGKQGFLPFSEIHPDYYQIPMSDRKKLMAEAEAADTAEPTAPEPVAEETPAETTPVEDSPIAELPPETTEPEHPSYLTQGPIEVSESVEDLPELPAPATEEPVEGETKSEEIAASGEAAPTATGEPAEGVETLQSEEEEFRHKKTNYGRRYKIQEVIRRGQIVLVQVIKEERGNKGASITTFLSLAGRYCVLMPNSPKDGGISRKIMSAEDRKRLKAITNELKLANGMSVIIRTAGMDRTRAEIKRDYDYLVKVWNQVREDTLKSNAPALIYEESNIIKRAIRDQYTNDIDEMLVEGAEAYESAKEFMKLLLPSHTPKIKLHEEPTPLFYAYNIEDQLLSMHDPVVKLRSGGYIVINPTEALISIDVNSGRSTGERNIEETATKTNLEAAAEVARQLKLRDLAGLIVIDFIDMLDSRHRRAVERMLKDSLKTDRAKIQLGRISPFGLLEMSRQRLRPSISETNMVQCAHCVGRGVVRSNESMSIQLIRAIEKEAATGNWGVLRLTVPQAVALHLLNTKRDLLRAIETRHTITIQVAIDLAMATSDYNLEKMRKAQNDGRRSKRDERPASPQPTGAIGENTNQSPQLSDALPEESARTHESASDEHREYSRGRGRNRRRGRRGGRRGEFRDDHAAPSEATEASTTEPTTESTETAPTADTTSDERRPRGRGDRGRRRWRDRDNRPPRESHSKPQLVEDKADGETLPAFTRENPIPPEPVHAPEPALVIPESTPRDPNAPTKKGWWQKMIELD